MSTIKYDPFEILKTEDGKYIIGESMVNIKKLSSTFVKDTAYSSIVSYYTGVTNWLGGIISFVEQLNVKYKIELLLKEQIEYVRQNPMKLRHQVELCMLITTTYYFYIFKLKNSSKIIPNTFGFVLKALSKMSIQKALVEQMMEDDERERQEKYYSLRPVLSFVLCLYLKENIITEHQAKYLVQNILYLGCHTSNLEDLMCTKNMGAYEGRILDSLKKIDSSTQNFIQLGTKMESVKEFHNWIIQQKSYILDNLNDFPTTVSVIGMNEAGKTSLLKSWGASVNNGHYERFFCNSDKLGKLVSSGDDYTDNLHLSDMSMLDKKFDASDYVVFVLDSYKFTNNEDYKKTVCSYLKDVNKISTSHLMQGFLYLVCSHKDRLTNPETTKENIKQCLSSIVDKDTIDNIRMCCTIDQNDCINIAKEIIYI